VSEILSWEEDECNSISIFKSREWIRFLQFGMLCLRQPPSSDTLAISHEYGRLGRSDEHLAVLGIIHEYLGKQ